MQLLVCGDQRGNLVAFSFPNFLLKYEKQPATFMVGDDVLESATLLHSCAVFKGAHGISAVASISISSNPSKAPDIISVSFMMRTKFVVYFIDVIITYFTLPGMFYINSQPS